MVSQAVMILSLPLCQHFSSTRLNNGSDQFPHACCSAFLNRTPEFQAVVVAISSPLPLTVRFPDA